MAAEKSAVSESENEWDDFKETAEKIEDLRANIQSLTEAIEEVRGVCNEFSKEYLDKIPREPEEIQMLRDKLKEMVVELKDELKKAVSEDIAIVFVGRTSSGKSSLINALLRESRLPVKKAQTTMCKIQVRPTAETEWSVEMLGCEKPVFSKMSKEDVKALLSKMSNAAEREKLNIDSHSVIQVNWPRHLCTLPENIVLIDTPGCSESTDGNKVVLDCCKEADILVGVMDFMSPSTEFVRKCLRYLYYHSWHAGSTIQINHGAFAEQPYIDHVNRF